MAAEMRVTDAVDCPFCEGRGVHYRYVCCNRGRTECCNEPDVDFEPCSACDGSGELTIDENNTP